MTQHAVCWFVFLNPPSATQSIEIASLREKKRDEMNGIVRVIGHNNKIESNLQSCARILPILHL